MCKNDFYSDTSKIDEVTPPISEELTFEQVRNFFRQLKTQPTHPTKEYIVVSGDNKKTTRHFFL